MLAELLLLVHVCLVFHTLLSHVLMCGVSTESLRRSPVCRTVWEQRRWQANNGTMSVDSEGGVSVGVSKKFQCFECASGVCEWAVEGRPEARNQVACSPGDKCWPFPHYDCPCQSQVFSLSPSLSGWVG